MTSIPEPKAKPKVTITMTVTFDGKENMSLSDMADINAKAIALVAEGKKLGAVEGSVVVGKQKFALEG